MYGLLLNDAFDVCVGVLACDSGYGVVNCDCDGFNGEGVAGKDDPELALLCNFASRDSDRVVAGIVALVE